MSLRDSLLPVVSTLRALPQNFGLRRFAVTIRRRVWTGSKISEGTATDSDIILTPPPRVRDSFPIKSLSPLEMEYVAANSNVVTGQMYKIDKITPRFTNADGSTGGYLAEQLRLWPIRDPRHMENLVVLVGDDGYLRECQQMVFEQDRAFGYSMLVKETDRPRTPLLSIAVTPAAPTVVHGLTLPMLATGTFNGGPTSQLTTLAQWQTSAPAVATVDIYGVVTGVAAGTATISASVLGVSGSTVVTVS